MVRLVPFTLTLLLALLQGCVALPPHIQDGIDIADSGSYSRITCDLNDPDYKNQGGTHVITFDTLNGTSLGPPFDGRRPTEINLLPGSHSFEVQYFHFGTIARGCLELVSEAGTNYILRHKARNYGIAFWLETTSGDVVGNLCGFKSHSGKPRPSSK